MSSPPSIATSEKNPFNTSIRRIGDVREGGGVKEEPSESPEPIEMNENDRVAGTAKQESDDDDDDFELISFVVKRKDENDEMNGTSSTSTVTHQYDKDSALLISRSSVSRSSVGHRLKNDSTASAGVSGESNRSLSHRRINSSSSSSTVTNRKARKQAGTSTEPSFPSAGSSTKLPLHYLLSSITSNGTPVPSRSSNLSSSSPRPSSANQPSSRPLANRLDSPSARRRSLIPPPIRRPSPSNSSQGSGTILTQSNPRSFSLSPLPGPSSSSSASPSSPKSSKTATPGPSHPQTPRPASSHPRPGPSRSASTASSSHIPYQPSQLSQTSHPHRSDAPTPSPRHPAFRTRSQSQESQTPSPVYPNAVVLPSRATSPHKRKGDHVSPRNNKRPRISGGTTVAPAARMVPGEIVDLTMLDDEDVDEMDIGEADRSLEVKVERLDESPIRTTTQRKPSPERTLLANQSPNSQDSSETTSGPPGSSRIAIDSTATSSTTTTRPANHVHPDLTGDLDTPLLEVEPHLRHRIKAPSNVFSRKSKLVELRAETCTRTFISFTSNRPDPKKLRTPLLYRNVRGSITGMVASRYPKLPQSVSYQRRAERSSEREAELATLVEDFRKGKRTWPDAINHRRSGFESFFAKWEGERQEYFRTAQYLVFELDELVFPSTSNVAAREAWKARNGLVPNRATVTVYHGAREIVHKVTLHINNFVFEKPETQVQFPKGQRVQIPVSGGISQSTPDALSPALNSSNPTVSTLLVPTPYRIELPVLRGPVKAYRFEVSFAVGDTQCHDLLALAEIWVEPPSQLLPMNFPLIFTVLKHPNIELELKPKPYWATRVPSYFAPLPTKTSTSTIKGSEATITYYHPPVALEPTQISEVTGWRCPICPEELGNVGYKEALECHFAVFHKGEFKATIFDDGKVIDRPNHFTIKLRSDRPEPESNRSDQNVHFARLILDDVVPPTPPQQAADNIMPDVELDADDFPAPTRIEDERDDHRPATPDVSLQHNPESILSPGPEMTIDPLYTVVLPMLTTQIPNHDELGLAGPFMGKRENDLTEWSSRIVPGTLVDLLPELDKIWDGGKYRHNLRGPEEDHILRLHYISYERRFLALCWGRWVDQVGPIPAINRDGYIKTFLDKYGPIMARAKLSTEVRDYFFRLMHNRYIDFNVFVGGCRLWNEISKQYRDEDVGGLRVGEPSGVEMSEEAKKAEEENGDIIDPVNSLPSPS
ncbi:hypothetical protein CI109_102972 [Kwoniella shandongensis]|uniref:Uncharacterized protein n=1 Tax=Kwoniella shandongensis TaxID=1734106 RepID=A0A5M6CDW0_9TREE|nr:uncharacterized protein CI109_000160 [Kwoniella shandongensis]KAA5531319.1 hypothetical protein CI109_000160 [Kwoniella shandongensis]